MTSYTDLSSLTLPYISDNFQLEYGVSSLLTKNVDVIKLAFSIEMEMVKLTKILKITFLCPHYI